LIDELSSKPQHRYSSVSKGKGPKSVKSMFTDYGHQKNYDSEMVMEKEQTIQEL